MGPSCVGYAPNMRSPTSRSVLVLTAMPVVTALGLSLAGCSSGEAPSYPVTRTTTAVAGAPVLGYDRDTSTACGPLAPPETSDPQRIVVADTASLDAACALGLWPRVVGVVGDAPTYLGTGIAALTRVTEQEAVGLSPNVVVRAEGSTWRERFRTAAAMMGRPGAADAMLLDFDARAQGLGFALSAGQTEASVVRFEADRTTSDAPESFVGSVLAAVGAQRPPAQRGAQAPSVEHGVAQWMNADVIFVVPDDVDAATSTMRTDAWRDLQAAADRRAFVADPQVWSTAGGPTAANAMLADLQENLNGYAS